MLSVEGLAQPSLHTLNFNDDIVYVEFVCLSTHGLQSVPKSFYLYFFFSLSIGNSNVCLDCRRVNVCVHFFVCSHMLETKIEAAHWAQVHAYAWTHTPPARSWLTQTCQRLNSTWHTFPQLHNTVWRRAGRLGEVFLPLCLPTLDGVHEEALTESCSWCCLFCRRAGLALSRRSAKAGA